MMKMVEFFIKVFIDQENKIVKKNNSKINI